MKIRLGFVSNSSSSSYTCDVCNVTESDWDMGLSEAGMMQCKKGHTFCEGHSFEVELSWEEKKEVILSSWAIKLDRYAAIRTAVKNATTEELFNEAEKTFDLEDWYEEVESGYEVPSRFCPICSFGKVHERDAFLYLLKVAGRDEADLLEELRERFGDYGKMKEWLKE